MKRFSVVAVVLMLLAMAGCGQKTTLDEARSMVRSGDCAGAADYLEQTIATPDDATELAHAYYLKGTCAERAGDKGLAFENYYAAKIVSCYVVAHETQASLNTYGQSEYCQRIIPEKLALLAKDIDAWRVEAITKKVDGALHDRYMEQFAK